MQYAPIKSTANGRIIMTRKEYDFSPSEKWNPNHYSTEELEQILRDYKEFARESIIINKRKMEDAYDKEVKDLEELIKKRKPKVEFKVGDLLYTTKTDGDLWVGTMHDEIPNKIVKVVKKKDNGYLRIQYTMNNGMSTQRNVYSYDFKKVPCKCIGCGIFSTCKTKDNL